MSFFALHSDPADFTLPTLNLSIGKPCRKRAGGIVFVVCILGESQGPEFGKHCIN